MYEATDDPYCYPGTGVLKNRLDLRTQAELDAFEAAITTQRADEPLPAGQFDADHYRAIHHHLFQDVYDWAGQIRSVRIMKGGNTFCFPENIDAQMRRAFAELARANQLRDLDFRIVRGEGRALHRRTQCDPSFSRRKWQNAKRVSRPAGRSAGHPLDFKDLHPPDMLQAMIASFGGDEEPLRVLILRLMCVR